jgi:hypothetical protein
MSIATEQETLEILRRVEPIAVRVEERLRIVETRAGGPDKRLDAVETRISTIEAKLAKLDARVVHIPTLAQIIGFTALLLLVLVLGSGLVQVFLR